MFRWIRRWYDRVLALSGHPKAGYYLAGISFLESSIFPIPPDVLLLPLCLARREKAMRLALVCTIFSVLGGAFGYLLGFSAFDTIGQPVLEFYGVMARYDSFAAWYQEQGPWVVFVAGFTPIPYKVITISAGVFRFNFVLFLILSVLSRGLRFGLEALFIRIYGEKAITLIDRHFNLLTILGGVLFVGGFLAVKFLVH